MLDLENVNNVSPFSGKGGAAGCFTAIAGAGDGRAGAVGG